MIEKEQESQVVIALKLKALSKQIADLESQNAKLMEVLKKNDLLDELEEMDVPLSDEEFICINELKKLRACSEVRELSMEETKIFDVLYKTLRTIRTGIVDSSDAGKRKKKKSINTAELFKLVQGE
jgi:hypothetical protein